MKNNNVGKYKKVVRIVEGAELIFDKYYIEDIYLPLGGKYELSQDTSENLEVSMELYLTQDLQDSFVKEIETDSHGRVKSHIVLSNVEVFTPGDKGYESQGVFKEIKLKQVICKHEIVLQEV
ncbi:MAG: hypothetical protein ACRCX2_38915 [Paraclostridium sp.]